MRSRSDRSWRRSRAGGLTLVEVLAALAILGTLLVSVLLAEARCRRQSAGARQRLESCRAADALLEQWWRDPGELPRSGQGDVPGHGELVWRTSVVENRDVRRLGGQVVRLEIRRRSGAPDEKATVSVDVVLPATKLDDSPGLQPD